MAFLLLSEINAEGRTKGRALDHRCDFALAMETVGVLDDGEDRSHVKRIRTTKSWHGPTGELGEFVLWWTLGRLVRPE